MNNTELLRQQHEEYEESLRQDELKEQQKLLLRQEKDDLQKAMEASLAELVETEPEEKHLSPRALRDVRLRYFEQKKKTQSNRGKKQKTGGLNESLILGSKLRSGKLKE